MLESCTKDSGLYLYFRIRHSLTHLRPVILSADWSISRLQSWTCSSLPTVAEFVKLTQSIVIEIQRQSADLYKVQLCNRQFFFVASTAVYVVKVYECHPLGYTILLILWRSNFAIYVIGLHVMAKRKRWENLWNYLSGNTGIYWAKLCIYVHFCMTIWWLVSTEKWSHLIVLVIASVVQEIKEKSLVSKSSEKKWTQTPTDSSSVNWQVYGGLTCTINDAFIYCCLVRLGELIRLAVLQYIYSDHSPLCVHIILIQCRSLDIRADQSFPLEQILNSLKHTLLLIIWPDEYPKLQLQYIVNCILLNLLFWELLGKRNTYQMQQTQELPTIIWGMWLHHAKKKEISSLSSQLCDQTGTKVTKYQKLINW